MTSRLRRKNTQSFEGGCGPDVVYLNRAPVFSFARYNADPAHVAVGGFSNGASYALSLGIINSTLFHYIIAFSPGLLVPLFTRAGYEVRYHEFEGGHEIPEGIRKEAVGWLTRGN